MRLTSPQIAPSSSKRWAMQTSSRIISFWEGTSTIRSPRKPATPQAQDSWAGKRLPFGTTWPSSTGCPMPRNWTTFTSSQKKLSHSITASKGLPLRCPALTSSWSPNRWRREEGESWLPPRWGSSRTTRHSPSRSGGPIRLSTATVHATSTFQS